MILLFFGIALVITGVILGVLEWIARRQLKANTIIIPIRPPEVVPCATCRHLIYKVEAQERKVRRDYGILETIYFCQEHHVLWERKVERQIYTAKGEFTGDWTHCYFREVECDENGKIKKGAK